MSVAEFAPYEIKAPLRGAAPCGRRCAPSSAATATLSYGLEQYSAATIVGVDPAIIGMIGALAGVGIGSAVQLTGAWLARRWQKSDRVAEQERHRWTLKRDLFAQMIHMTNDVIHTVREKPDDAGRTPAILAARRAMTIAHEISLITDSKHVRDSLFPLWTSLGPYAGAGRRGENPDFRRVYAALDAFIAAAREELNGGRDLPPWVTPAAPS